MLNKVSIIVPVYNVEKYISRCLNSIVNQTYKNIEIILVNDGSNDNSEVIINKYKDLDHRIKYFYQCNSGPSKARNFGIKKSTGDYITFVDADDYISSDYIENLVIEAIYNKYDIVACGYTDISKYGEIKLNDFWNGKKKKSKIEFFKDIFKGVGGTLWGKIFKRDIIINNDIRMPTDIYMCEDLLFNLEYVLNSNTYGVINKNLYYYNRLNDNRISSQLDLSYYENFIEVLSKLEFIFKQYDVDSELVNIILSSRFKDIILKFVLIEDSKYNYKFNERKQIINYILKSKYFYYYNDIIVKNDLNEKIVFMLLNKKMSKCLIIYAIARGKLQNIKNIIRGIW